MKLIELFLPSHLVEAFGWMILHSLWQGAIISVVLGLVMILTHKFSAKSRYFIAIVTLLFMPAIAIFTFVKNYNPVGVAVINQTPAISNTFVQENGNSYLIENLSDIQTSPDREISFRLRSYRKYFYQHIPLIVTIWLLGMLVFALKFLGGLAYTQRLKHYRIQAVTEEWQRTFNRLCETLKLNKAVKILQSAMVKVPMVIGFFKPVVLIPVSAFTGLPAKQLEIIIMHELAHIVRRDYIFNLLQSLVEIVFFFHPAIWWISKVIRTEREHCCDDIAIEETGDSVNFAKALANIQEQFLLRENLAMTINGGNNNLFKRVKRLLNQPNMKTSFTEGFTASCIIFAGIFILMLNTGSTRLADRESIQPKTNQFINDALSNVDDTVRIAAIDKPAGRNSVEDKLLELEKGQEKNPDIKQQEKADELMKEAMKAQLEAAMKREEADKAQMIAEIKKQDAERAIKAAEMEMRNSQHSSDTDRLMEEEILKGVEAGLEDMDIDVIVDEAMAGAGAGINGMDMNLIVSKAIEGVNYGVEEGNAEIIVSEILHGIEAAFTEMNLNVIANEVMSGLSTALKEIDISKIVDNQIKNNTAHENFKGSWEHLNKISKGVDNWNKWRNDNPRIIPDLRGASLTDANLNSIDLHDALLDNIDLKEAVLDWANLNGASLKYAMLKEASFNGAKLMRADFTGANLKEVNLEGHILRNTVFNNAELKEADLTLADLRDSDLSYANLREANLIKADMRGANLKGADLSEAQLSGAKFGGAIADDFTRFPAGFNPDAAGIIIKK